MGVLLVIDKKIVVKRGFLFGPYIPIYGFGMFIMAFFLKGFEDNLFILFLLSMLSAGILEYLTSYLMEKVYGYRWWDYTYSKFNINGRVTLELLLMFGLDGILVVKFINPLFTNMINSLPSNVSLIIGIILFSVFIIDLIFSLFISLKIKDDIRKIAKKDSTEIIKQKAKKYLIENILSIFAIK